MVLSKMNLFLNKDFYVPRKDLIVEVSKMFFPDCQEQICILNK